MTDQVTDQVPQPRAYMDMVLDDVYRQACATAREYGGVPEQIVGFRYPRPRPVRTIERQHRPDEFHGTARSVRRTLWAWKTDCAVYVRHRGGQVVAVAVWPGRAWSAVRAAGPVEDSPLDVPWLRESMADGTWRPPSSRTRSKPGWELACGALFLLFIAGAFILWKGVIGLRDGTTVYCADHKMKPGESCTVHSRGTKPHRFTYEDAADGWVNKYPALATAIGATLVAVPVALAIPVSRRAYPDD
ncbi:hypothetical protein [Streptomyces sp. UNOC14_S4]|uniref:hypothetical protein n=1 Tax=Streptomyces sp. UNOC14_S4 TaxID=2872340 RepID=UPI001E2EC316|nr:hypothetical protein [Streptomyces sp. UNOC14_S4]MCC3771864.1 hypothetical protein [Streptomyces sp. UNOC14_S4]